MKTATKVAVSIAGSFLVGLTTAYQANPTSGSPWTWVMGGLAPVGGYLVGFYQINPAIRRPNRTKPAP